MKYFEKIRRNRRKPRIVTKHANSALDDRFIVINSLNYTKLERYVTKKQILEKLKGNLVIPKRRKFFSAINQCF